MVYQLGSVTLTSLVQLRYISYCSASKLTKSNQKKKTRGPSKSLPKILKTFVIYDFGGEYFEQNANLVR